MKDSSTVKNSLLFSADFAAHAFYAKRTKIFGSDMKIKRKSIFFLWWKVFFLFREQSGAEGQSSCCFLLGARNGEGKIPRDNNFTSFNFQHEASWVAGTCHDVFRVSCWCLNRDSIIIISWRMVWSFVTELAWFCWSFDVNGDCFTCVILSMTNDYVKHPRLFLWVCV